MLGDAVNLMAPIIVLLKDQGKYSRLVVSPVLRIPNPFINCSCRMNCYCSRDCYTYSDCCSDILSIGCTQTGEINLYIPS